jgi:hypothetical protein
VKKSICCSAVSGILLFIGTLGVASAQERAPESTFQVGFNSTITDAEVSRVLTDHSSAQPVAAFIWSYGLSGTYRDHRPADPAVFVQNARVQIIEHLSKGLEDANRLIAHFVSEHKEGELADRPELAKQARSLLNLRKQYEYALASAIDGQALVYGLEFRGSDSVAYELAVDSDVRVSSRVDGTMNTIQARRSLKPTEYRAAYSDPEVATLSRRQLYDRLVAEASDEELIGEKR